MPKRKKRENSKKNGIKKTTVKFISNTPAPYQEYDYTEIVSFEELDYYVKTPTNPKAVRRF